MRRTAADPYLARVNRVIDHVMAHLDEPLSLDVLAKIACFSPCHFHRIWKVVVGETVHDFVKRARLMRAVHLMTHAPQRTLTDVALACGFTSSSDFSRSFRAAFGVSPRAFDLAVYQRQHRARLLWGIPGVAAALDAVPSVDVDDGAFSVRLRRLPARRVAYLRLFSPYGDAARMMEGLRTLEAWAEEHGFAGRQWLGYQWEDPEITPLADCRYHIAVEVDADTAVDVDGVIGVTDFPAAIVAEVDVVGSIELELRVLTWLFHTWLPHSGYAPDHQPCFEAWHGKPYAHGAEQIHRRQPNEHQNDSPTPEERGFGEFALTVQLAVVPA